MFRGMGRGVRTGEAGARTGEAGARTGEAGARVGDPKGSGNALNGLVGVDGGRPSYVSPGRLALGLIGEGGGRPACGRVGEAGCWGGGGNVEES